MSHTPPNNIVLLEGFHACKHAVRFNADITELVTPDIDALTQMLDQYAPDVKNHVLEKVTVVSQSQFDNYSNVSIRTPLSGVAHIPRRLDLLGQGPVVLLDNPRDLENIGAVVRLAAGMDSAAVITTGEVDPWHKNCLRGSQGLHFALPVLHIKDLATGWLSDRTVYAFDESGENMTDIVIPKDAVLVFGSERKGVSDQWLNKADKTVKIPQRQGVSSYNLATSVAMGVYHSLHSR